MMQLGHLNRIRIVVSLIVLIILISCESEVRNENPKLVVMVTIDQLRAGYLERYDSVFTGGFRRLRDEGWRCDTALVDHAPTLSWPGHTTIATGAYPGHHGIRANAFIQDKTSRHMYLYDEDHHILGHPQAMNLSGRRIRTTAMADWIRAADPDAEAVALSTGPGLAVCYGGISLGDRSKNHVYWLDRTAGEFITSTFYRDAYPQWVMNFNEHILPRYKEATTWDLAVPEAYHHLARADEAPYEKNIGGRTTFPHKLEDLGAHADARTRNYWFYNYSPYAEEALFHLAGEAINALQLGRRASTDYLAIAVKSTDRIGHDYGPRSLEQLDVLYRIDRQLGNFLDLLDRTVGRGNYLLSLQADHGAPNIVEYEIEQGRPAKRVTQAEIKNLLAGIDDFIDAYTGPLETLPERIARELEKSDFIAEAMTEEDLMGTGPAGHILDSYRHSHVAGHTTTFPLWTDEILRGAISPHHPGNYGVIVEFAENAQLYTAPSAHASSHWYDQEVPIIFLGSGIKPGISTESARTIDIAPTLAHLAGIPCPENVDGRVLNVR